jgi:hypothetical protein
MSVARAKVYGRFDTAGAGQSATVELERELGLFSVRPYRRRKVYTLPLAVVAEMVCHRIMLSEAAEKRRMKREKGRRRG